MIAAEAERLMALMNGGPFEYARFLEAIHTLRYTGTYTVHCLNGVPKQIDLGPPIRLSIVEGLDKRRPPRPHS